MSNCPELNKLVCSNIKEVSSLEISNCPNLKTVICNDNKLAELNIKECLNLKKLDCSNNLLINIDLNWNDKLECLNVRNNNFSEQNLSFLSHLTNLKKLQLGNGSKERIDQGVYNRFVGSLEFLQNLDELEILRIENTDLDIGLEYLPDSIKDFSCLTNLRKDAKVQNIGNLLADEQGIVKTMYRDGSGPIENFSLKLQAYKHKIQIRDLKVDLLKQRIKELENLIKKQKQKIIDAYLHFAPEKELLQELIKMQLELTKFEKQELNSPDYGTKYYEYEEEYSKKKKELYAKLAKAEDINEVQQILTDCKQLVDWELELENARLKNPALLLEDKKSVPQITFDNIREKELQKLLLTINYSNWIEKPELIKKKIEDDKQLDIPTKNKSEISIAPIIPTQLQNTLKNKNKSEENYDIKEIVYNQIYEEKSTPWININKSLPVEKLPLRLYNVEKEEDDPKKCIENIKEGMEAESYAALSYVCKGEYNKESGELSPGGKKSLKKAIEACRHLEIKYLWMDQLCINQNDWKEKEQEIPKMRKYYSNSTVTLISIQRSILNGDGQFPSSLDEVLKAIVRSEWFQRSWTFQEGWLSKQTIFMFDDCLADGRYLAAIWALHQGHSDYGKYNDRKEFDKSSKKIATPLGWVYYQDGYDSEDKVSLSLNQVLRLVRERKRSLTIDGIYSILGLLPYGEKVTVDYSLKPEDALRNVMKIAVQEGYGEVLAWYGEGNDWIPYIDNNGSTSVVGGIDINYIPKSADFIKPNGIEINGLKCIISDPSKGSCCETSENIVIDGGIYRKEVSIKFVNNNEYIKRNLKLTGTKETLEKIKTGDILLIPNEKEWRSNTQFALLVTRKGSRYYRLGLVKFHWQSSENLENFRKEKLIISIPNIQEIDKELATNTKRQLSLESQEKTNQGETKQAKVTGAEYQTEPIEIKETQNWQNFHSDFTSQLIQQWQSHNFTYNQCKEWIDIGLKPTDANFCAWLRDTKHLNPEQVLNHGNPEQLNQEFFNWWQNQSQSHIQIPPKGNN